LALRALRSASRNDFAPAAAAMLVAVLRALLALLLALLRRARESSANMDRDASATSGAHPELAQQASASTLDEPAASGARGEVPARRNAKRDGLDESEPPVGEGKRSARREARVLWPELSSSSKAFEESIPEACRSKIRLRALAPS